MIKHEERLNDVHSHLARVIRLAANKLSHDITIIEGARSPAAHKKNVADGKSRTTRSRHVKANNRSDVACAVDMAPLLDDGTIPWHQWDKFKRMNAAVQAAAKELKSPVEWGGDWKTLKDGNHWQLPWKQYP
jgi:peptidoglycan L-alanyl-D-glutamate endopeptidase CwlK